MARPIVFLDTETTSLNRRTRQAWDIAMIRREPDGTDTEHAFFVSGIDLAEADPISLRMNHFYDRYRMDHEIRGVTEDEQPYMSPIGAARAVERMTRGAYLVGAVPSFDEETLAQLLYDHGLVPAWHYHLKDVENLAEGWLYGRGMPIPEGGRSDDLSRAVGVEPPGDDDRHTAIGDARWVRDLYDTVIGARRL